MRRVREVTRSEAISFLRKHQPMPPDKELSTELITEYDEVRKYFVEHPDLEAVPLLLNSFGQGTGHGVYQLVGNALRTLPSEKIIPYLRSAIRSEHPSVRSWCAEIAAEFPSAELIPALSMLLEDDDEDARSASVFALEFIDDPQVDKILTGMLKTSDDSDLCEQITEALFHRQERRRVSR